MSSKTIRITYWVMLILFCLAMLMDSFGGITHQQAGVEVMKHLGYPEYVLTLFGIAKLLGVIALLQNRFKVIKEWAFAGFSFNFIGAAMSRAFAGDGTGLIIFPLVMLAYTLVLYYFWKRSDALKASPAKDHGTGSIARPSYSLHS